MVGFHRFLSIGGKSLALSTLLIPANFSGEDIDQSILDRWMSLTIERYHCAYQRRTSANGEIPIIWISVQTKIINWTIQKIISNLFSDGLFLLLFF